MPQKNNNTELSGMYQFIELKQAVVHAYPEFFHLSK